MSEYDVPDDLIHRGFLMMITMIIMIIMIGMIMKISFLLNQWHISFVPLL